MFNGATGSSCSIQKKSKTKSVFIVKNEEAGPSLQEEEAGPKIITHPYQ